MIVINKNTTTNFVATLFELSQLTNPDYLFEFESDQTKTKFYTIIADISTNKIRYNEWMYVFVSHLPLQKVVQYNSVCLAPLHTRGPVCRLL